MLSIDEAIAMMHEWADYECYNEEQIQASEAFNQIAVLLEELKDYRDKNKMVVRVDVENMDNIKDKIDELTRYAESQYNKALDDFAKALTTMYERYDIDDVFESSDTYSYTSACYIFEHYIDEIAEQLKVGIKE